MFKLKILFGGVICEISFFCFFGDHENFLPQTTMLHSCFIYHFVLTKRLQKTRQSDFQHIVYTKYRISFDLLCKADLLLSLCSVIFFRCNYERRTSDLLLPFLNLISDMLLSIILLRVTTWITYQQEISDSQLLFCFRQFCQSSQLQFYFLFWGDEFMQHCLDSFCYC